MWDAINILLSVIGALLFAYANHIDSSENTEALLLGLLGAALFVIGGISAAVKWLWF